MCATGDDPMQGGTQSGNEPPMPTRALRVLIVEDEQRLRDLLVDVLPDMGYPVPSAVRSAEEALRAMDAASKSSPARTPDVVLLDLQLPAMGGMEFFQQLKSRWPKTQVIIMTGFGDLEAAQQAIRLDVVDFLTKPCPLRDVELALERARRRVHSTERAQTNSRGSVDSANASWPGAPVGCGARTPTPGMTLWEAERKQILAALRRNNGNRTAAAAELGISRRTLHYRLNEYQSLGLNLDESDT
jgi:DNA-binding NtrC family response regulator